MEERKVCSSECWRIHVKASRYDVDKVSEKVWKKARDGWINKASFDPIEVKKISVSAATLCTWAKAVSSFQLVVKKVAPKKAKLAEVKGILAAA